MMNALFTRMDTLSSLLESIRITYLFFCLVLILVYHLPSLFVVVHHDLVMRSLHWYRDFSL
jgi:hypothetical protein